MRTKEDQAKKPPGKLGHSGLAEREGYRFPSLPLGRSFVCLLEKYLQCFSRFASLRRTSANAVRVLIHFSACKKPTPLGSALCMAEREGYRFPSLPLGRSFVCLLEKYLQCFSRFASLRRTSANAVRVLIHFSACKKPTPLGSALCMAEREGFEPSVPIARHNCFRDSPVQPLLHLSI